ncbi:MAG: response regulator [Magnetospirillum sp. WYHS-4]
MSKPYEPIAFIVDDDAAICDALSVHLGMAGIAVRTFLSAEAFLDAVDPDQPGCAVIDIRMPGMDGLDLQREMNRRGLVLPVIVITGHGDVPAAVAAFRSGALDFLQKPFDEEVLIERIREGIAKDVEQRRTAIEVAEIRQRVASLSPRERQVMDRVAEGDSNKVVALKLGIGVRTVETHRARVMEKTGAKSVSELARMRIRLQDAP